MLNRTAELIGKSGVIGEETNRLLMYLIFTSRKREHPLHIISLGNSGIGKTYSENALYYFGKTELQHGLVLIEDLDNAENVLYPLRELQGLQWIGGRLHMQ